MTAGAAPARAAHRYDLDSLRNAHDELMRQLPRTPGQVLEVKDSPAVGITVRLADVETASRLDRALRLGDGTITTSGGFTRGRWAGTFRDIGLALIAASTRREVPS